MGCLQVLGTHDYSMVASLLIHGSYHQVWLQFPAGNDLMHAH